MDEPTTVQFFKYPDSRHWHFQTTRLGTDEHGVWLGAPADTPARRGSEPPTTFRSPFVMLIPPEHWWAMVANEAPHDPEIYVDVCTRAEWPDEHRVEMIDLDLDVVRRRDGSVVLLDEDEFLEHSDRLSYPHDLVVNARVTAAELILAVERHSEPFGSAARRWLDVLAGLS